MPVISSINLNADEAFVYAVLRKNYPKSISEIMEEVPFKKSKTAALLKRMVENHYITIVGSGRGTKYKI